MEKTARPNLPETSRAAWAAKQGTVDTDHRRIIMAIHLYGGEIYGLNYEQISNYAQMDRVAVARRLSELETSGQIEKTGHISKTESGRMANCYKLKIK